MDSIKIGKLLVILTVAIIAFTTSTVIASLTDGDEILNMLNINVSNESTQLIAVGGGNFTPVYINQAVIPVANNTTNETNGTNITNNTTNIKNVSYSNNVKSITKGN